MKCRQCNQEIETLQFGNPNYTVCPDGYVIMNCGGYPIKMPKSYKRETKKNEKTWVAHPRGHAIENKDADIWWQTHYGE